MPVNDVTALYPIGTYDSPSRVLAAADTDDRFICATMHDAGRIARYVSKTFLYESDEPDPGLFVQGSPTYPPQTSPAMRAWGDDHSSDLAYWFGVLPVSEQTGGRAALSMTMMDYLGNFTRDADPDGFNLKHWQPFTASQSTVLRFGVPVLQGFDA